MQWASRREAIAVHEELENKNYLKIMEENIVQHLLNDNHGTTASYEISLMSKLTYVLSS